MKLSTNFKSWSTRAQNGIMAVTFLLAYAISMVAPFVPAQTASAAPGCVVDTSGANDEPGQKDLNKMCQDDTSATSIDISWQWDEIQWTGNNTGDACALFDTDGDGNANYSVCVTIGGNAVQQANSPRIYSCGDDASQKCTQPIGLIAGPYANTTCTVSVQNVDPFTGVGDAYPKDAVATCTISLALVGGQDTARLVDVCSFPSQEPNSDPSDCVVFITAKVAYVEVVKDIVSANPTGLFNLTVDGPAAADTTTVNDQGDGGTTGKVAFILPQGGNNYTASVSETAGTGTSLANYTSSISCVNRGTSTVVASGSGTSLTGVPLADKSDIVCTITNAQNGSITIVKDAQPNSSQVFDFTATNVPGTTAFTLTDDGTSANTRTFTNMLPGTYGFAETGETNWDLTQTICTDGSPASAVVLSAGENVTCTFTNVQRGQLVVQKTTLPAGDGQAFAITASTTNGEVIGSASGSVTDATDHTYTVKPGTYSVAETVPAGWAKTDDTCQNVTVAPGETKYCTITNTKLGQVSIIKNAVPNAAQDFGFTATGQGTSNFALDDDSDPTLLNTKTFSDLLPGSYTFTEAETAGWDFAGFSSCTAAGITTDVATRTVTIVVAPGQSYSCTFENKMHGQIIVRKATQPAGDTTQFSVAASSSNGGQIFGSSTGSVTDDTDATFSVQQDKTYAVTETVPAGWTMTQNTCSGLTVTANSTLVNGIPTVYCDITNQKLGTLTIVKQTNPDGDAAVFDFTKTVGAVVTPFTLSDGDSEVFGNLAVGTEVTVGEMTETGWSLTGITCTGGATANLINRTISYTPTAGGSATCTFNNTKLGSISGTKWEVDANGDPVSQTGLSGWTIFLDANGNGLLDTGEVQTTTNASGDYSFTDLFAGVYHVYEVLKSGWTQIFGVGAVELAVGENEVDKDFGNFQNGSISGYKWNDLNGNADWDALAPVESGLAGWTIFLDENGNKLHDEDEEETTTAADGSYSFTNLAPGTYTVCEHHVNGWTQTYPASNGCHTVVINESGETNPDTNFGNQGRGSLAVVKHVDTDGDGDVDESNVTDWTWEYDGDNGSDDELATGSTNVQAVAAGEYTVTENQKTDYHLTSVSCSDESAVTQDETITVNVSPGESLVCTFTNTRDTGFIHVTKHLNPSDDDGLFDLLIDGTVEKADASDGDTTGAVRVLTGTHTVSEEAGTDTDLADYDSWYSCTTDDEVRALDSVMGTPGTSISDVDVDRGETVHCHFYNERKPELTVVKDALPNGPQDFHFTLTPVEMEEEPSLTALVDNGTHFTLDDDTDATLSNEWTKKLSAGVYRVTEDSVEGWDLTDLTCDGTEMFEVDGNAVYVELTAGDQVTCTFENTQRATVTIKKDAQPDMGQPFNFTTTLGKEGTTFTLTDDGVNAALASKKFELVMPGTYTVTEDALAGWTLNDIKCTGATMVRDGGKLTLTVEPGAEVTCTFVNQKNAPQVLGETTLLETGNGFALPFLISTGILGLSFATVFGADRRRANRNR